MQLQLRPWFFGRAGADLLLKAHAAVSPERGMQRGGPDLAALKYWLWLTTRRGFRPVDCFRLIEHFGSPEGAYFADPAE